MVHSSYSFPNVSVNSSVPGPVPQQGRQRRRIGVAGVFDRGPEFQLINSREQFAYLFGENNSTGSVFVRQAMLQGADQFAVSRVMPSLKPSKGFISLSSGQNSYYPANVASQGNRTIGMRFNMSYLSSIVTPSTQYTPTTITTTTESDIKIPRFKGAGSFNFRVEEKVIPSSVTVSADISLEVKNLTLEDNLLDSETLGTNQAFQGDSFDSEIFLGDADFSVAPPINLVSLVVASDKTSIDLLIKHAKPGLILKANDNLAGNGNTTLRTGLEFLTYAYELKDGKWGALLKGYADFKLPFIGKVHPRESDSHFFVISYNYDSPTFSLLPKYLLTAKTFFYGDANNLQTFKALGFLVVSSNNLSSFINIDLIGAYSENETLEGADYIRIHTGISLVFRGLAAQNTIEFLPGNTFFFSIVKNDISIGETDLSQPNSSQAFKPGTPVTQILQELKVALSKDTVGSVLLGDIEINQTQLPYSLEFSTNFRGIEANKVKYSLNRFVTGGSNSAPIDILFGGQGTNSNYDKVFNMSGGQNTLSSARKVLYDINGNPLVLIEAVSPGLGGNKIRINVNSIRPGQFQLTVDDEEGENFNIPIRSETFFLSNYTIDPQTGLYPETIDSNIIRAYFVPIVRNNTQAPNSSIFDLTPQRIAPIAAGVSDINNPLSSSYVGSNFLRDMYLEGGSTPASYNPINPQVQDYIDAIDRLESVDCSYICAPGIVVGDFRHDKVISTLVLQAQNSDQFNGVRKAILSAPKGLSSSRAAAISEPFNSNRVVIVSGWTSIVGASGLGFNNASPEGLYAGLLSRLPEHISPAAASRGARVTGVFSVDTNNNPIFLDELTRANIEVLYFDAGLGVFKFLNGLNTDRDPSMKVVAVSRMNEKIIEDLTRNLAWAKSSPNNDYLQRTVKDAVDAYFRTLLREEQIFSFNPTICDRSNNTGEDRAQRRLNINISYTPLYPADYIRVNLKQVINEQITINTR